MCSDCLDYVQNVDGVVGLPVGYDPREEHQPVDTINEQLQAHHVGKDVVHHFPGFKFDLIPENSLHGVLYQGDVEVEQGGSESPVCQEHEIADLQNILLDFRSVK